MHTPPIPGNSGCLSFFSEISKVDDVHGIAASAGGRLTGLFTTVEGLSDPENLHAFRRGQRSIRGHVSALQNSLRSRSRASQYVRPLLVDGMLGLGLDATVDRREEQSAEHAALTRPIITFHSRPSLACQVSLPAMPGRRPYRHLLDFQLVRWASKFRTISIACGPSGARTRRAGSTYAWREPACTWAAMCAPVSQKCT